MRTSVAVFLSVLCVSPAWAQQNYKNSLGMEFVKVPAGKFVMGTDCGGQDFCKNEEPQHEVTISNAFWIARTEVTQAQWRAVMNSNPSKFSGDDRPVEQVSWDDAVNYANKLSEREGCNHCYRLPTEAEWEYMARLDHATTQNAVYADNSAGQTAPVCSKRPGLLNLCDVLGNVWEWTADWYGPYETGPQSDPQGREVGQYRVNRGGSWNYTYAYVRSGNRSYAPDYRYDNVGFRLLRASP